LKLCIFSLGLSLPPALHWLCPLSNLS